MSKQLMGEAAQIPDCQVMLISNAEPDPIRQLDVLLIILKIDQAQNIGKVVTIAGIIISASTISAKATHIQIMCRACRATKVLPVSSGFAGVQLPRNCES